MISDILWIFGALVVLAFIFAEIDMWVEEWKHKRDDTEGDHDENDLS